MPIPKCSISRPFCFTCCPENRCSCCNRYCRPRCCRRCHCGYDHCGCCCNRHSCGSGCCCNPCCGSTCCNIWYAYPSCFTLSPSLYTSSQTNTDKSFFYCTQRSCSEALHSCFRLHHDYLRMWTSVRGHGTLIHHRMRTLLWLLLRQKVKL